MYQYDCYTVCNIRSKFVRIIDDPDAPNNGSNTIDIGAVEVQEPCFATADRTLDDAFLRDTGRNLRD
jgi:hypothetical protein